MIQLVGEIICASSLARVMKMIKMCDVVMNQGKVLLFVAVTKDTDIGCQGCIAMGAVVC